MTERRLVMTVEEVFTVGSGRGLIVAPRFVPERARRGAFTVTVRRPDGSERAARAELQLAHVQGHLPSFAMLRLLDVTDAGEVPPGSEIFAEPDP